MPTTVVLPNGMTVFCLQKHEVPLLLLEVDGYLSNGLELRAGNTVFDVGANIGLFSLAAYEHCECDLSIYAFEPVAAICDVLRTNIERNTANGQVHVLPFGLSHGAETVSLTYYPRAPHLSTAYPDKEADLRMIEDLVIDNIMYLDDAPLLVRGLRWIPKVLRVPLVHFALRRALRTELVTCQMRSLSQFVADRDIEHIDLLKIDVEKAELDVLLGIEDEDWGKIRQVIVELHDLEGRLKTITALLKQKGLTEITVEQPRTLVGSKIFNVFAARPPAREGAD
jgi:FkbM family methyltransferase